MNYHNIKHDDMLNGDGLRVTLFVSGCTHKCPGCQNPETHDVDSGIPFDIDAFNEIAEELKKDYISGLTISGGDPLIAFNIGEIADLVELIKAMFPQKNIWLYTGYTIEEIKNLTSPFGNTNKLLRDAYIRVLSNVDVLVEGRFVKELADVNAPWVGSTNQRIINSKGMWKNGY